jgi:hypothetical protein
VGPSEELAFTPGRRAALRLVTCWPPQFVGPAPDRMVVSAELARSDLNFEPPQRAAPRDPEEEASSPAAPPVVLPFAPEAHVVELLPIAGAAGVGVSALSLFAAPQSRRRSRWFGAFTGGGLVVLAALVIGLAG